MSCHAAEFVNLYTKAFMFLRNILLVKFSTGISELIKEGSHIPKSVIVIVILIQLVHIVAKMQTF